MMNQFIVWRQWELIKHSSYCLIELGTLLIVTHVSQMTIAFIDKARASASRRIRSIKYRKQFNLLNSLCQNNTLTNRNRGHVN